VVVAIRTAQQLVVFSYTGQLLKEITLASSLLSPRHALQLDGNRYLLCHGWGGSAHGICVVDAKGRILRAAARRPMSTSPTHMAIDQHGNILVAEFFGNAVQQYDKQLNYINDVIAQSSGLNRPFRLCLDNATGHLYVGEYNHKGRVLLYDKK